MPALAAPAPPLPEGERDGVRGAMCLNRSSEIPSPALASLGHPLPSREREDEDQSAATSIRVPSQSAIWCCPSGQERRNSSSSALPSAPVPTGSGASRGLSPATRSTS